MLAKKEIQGGYNNIVNIHKLLELRMKIQKITMVNNFAVKQITPQKREIIQSNNYSYNPIAYQDYNVNFKARLFRTPENFYEQSFNRDNMPFTMKTYLFNDYADRKNMPPNQMMKLVYGDIEETESLEQVKRIFPQEPLFANLTDVPNKKARTGIISEIELMRQENKTLFKNGKDNLGHYIIKKIYLEGKTLKEINTDFEKDISVHYKGLSPIQYETLSAFGIKFPKSAFWKSFIATREDFPYEYKPRKAAEHRNGIPENRTANVISKPKTEPKKFVNVKEWEIEKLSDAVINGKGNIEETKRQIKKSSLKNTESSNFVAKYLSEISSIVLERVHASDEMKHFAENYDKLTSSEKSMLDAYWNSNPQIKEHRSIVMKDTIKLFMDAYGVDGNNDEFRHLIKYAQEIKPERLKTQKLHDLKQAEYDEMFEKLQLEGDEVKEEIKQEAKITKSIEKPDALTLNDDKPLRSFTVIPASHEIKYNGDLDESLRNLLKEELTLLPDGFVKRYTQYLMNHPLINDKYKLTLVIDGMVPEGYEDTILPSEEMNKISYTVNKDFTKKYSNVMVANDQSLVELISTVKPEGAEKLLPLQTDDIMKLARTLGLETLNPSQRTMINANYQDYLKPITSKEDLNKINAMIVDFAQNFEKSSFYEIESQLNILMKLMSINLKENPSLKKDMQRSIKYNKFIEQYGGSAKILLKDNVTHEMKKAKLELMISDLMSSNVHDISNILSDSLDNLNKYLKNVDFDLYQLLKERCLRRKYFMK